MTATAQIDPIYKADLSHYRPLIRRLIKVAGDHPGTFLVATVGSENPENGAQIGNWFYHVPNDPGVEFGISRTIDVLTAGGKDRIRGFNVYLGIQLMRDGLTNKQKGHECDVTAVLAAVTDWDGKHDPATRHARLPLSPHGEVESSPGNFQSWLFFDRPYPVVEAKPVLEALARATGSDATQSCDHVFRVPGTLNWPSRRKIDAGRDPAPVMAKLVHLEPDARITLDELRAAILAKYPDAFDAPAASGIDFDWDIALPSKPYAEQSDDKIRERLAQETKDGTRSAVAYGVMRWLLSCGYSPAQVRDKLIELDDGANVLAHYRSDAALEADIRRAFTKEFRPEPKRSAVFRAFIPPDEPAVRPPRREIKLIGGARPANLDDAELALIEQGTDLFQRGDMIMRPGDGNRLYRVSAIEMREHLTAAAAIQKWNERKHEWLPVDCPEDFAAGYLARAGQWKLRKLTAVIDAPTLRSDGMVHNQPGYDAVSELYLIPDRRCVVPPIPPEPTKADATAALDMLKSLIRGYHFAGPADRAVALAAMLTAPVRAAMLPTAPMILVDAPVAGSGKGKLVDTVAMVATGRRADMISQGRTEEETEKRLSSLLMDGALCISLDNCTLPIEGDFLCSLLTATDGVRARILGKSEVPKLPATTMLFATGNNLFVRGDMTRRVLRCRIDPGVERPETRHFDFDPVETAQRERGQYLAAVLTVLRAHTVAGRPDRPPRLGSFENWSDTVRAALIWLGEPDPCDTMKEIAADDDTTATLGEVLAIWFEKHGSAQIKATDVALSHDLLSKIAPDRRGDGYSPVRLGHYLKRNTGRIVGALRLTRHKSNVTLWRVEQVKPA